jgi:hypothetical protein
LCARHHTRRQGSRRTVGPRYYNIGAHPDKVRAVIDGRTVAVAPEQLRGPERETVWKRITATAPRFAQYQEKTDRELPIIRLTPQ